MKLMRALIDRMGKWLMIGLVVFLMIIFTVTGDFGDSSSGDDANRRPGADEVAGSFYVVPGVKIDVNNARFTQGRRALEARSFIEGGRGQEPSVLQVWSHLILSEAAEKIYPNDLNMCVLA